MANKYVTVAGAGAKTGVDWANAFGLAEFITDYEGSAAIGDVYYVAGGTYAHTNDLFCFVNGTTTSVVKCIGVDSGTTNEPPITSDYADGTDRPLFTFTSNERWWPKDYNQIFNMRITGDELSSSGLIDTGTGSILNNCLVDNASSGVSARAIDLSGICFIINCEVSAASSYGIYATGTNNVIYNTYVHSCGVSGIYVNDYNTIFNCIINDCVKGIEIDPAEYGFSIVNNTIYGCTNGIFSGANSGQAMIMNNTISGCTNGFNANDSGTVRASFVFDYNNWYGNTKDMSWDNGSTEDNSAKGMNALAVDPQFTTAGSDFSLDSGSALIGAAKGIEAGVG